MVHTTRAAPVLHLGLAGALNWCRHCYVEPSHMPQVYLNGRFMAPEAAQISPMDRGFLFADGIYEVIPAYNGVLFRFEEHLARLERSLTEVDIHNPHSREHWQTLCDELLQHNGGGNLSVYLQITRGAAEKTRPCISLPRRDAHRLHDDQPNRRTCRRQPGYRRRRQSHHAGRYSLGPLRHQIRFPVGQQPAPPAGRGRRRGRSHSATRRLCHRRLGQQCLCSQRRQHCHPRRKATPFSAASPGTWW